MTSGPSNEPDTSGRPSARSTASRHPPRWVPALTLAYAVALFGSMVLYLLHYPPLRLLPDPLGPVPLPVPWFGALGGVTMGMRGLYKHGGTWDPAYTFRYVARPISGAIVGIVSYLILIVVIFATGSTPRTSGSLVYPLVAFLVGYREETFRDIVARAADTLLTGKASSQDERHVPTDSSEMRPPHE